jgi:hypothetical protein
MDVIRNGREVASAENWRTLTDHQKTTTEYHYKQPLIRAGLLKIRTVEPADNAPQDQSTSRCGPASLNLHDAKNWNTWWRTVRKNVIASGSELPG